MTKLDESGFVRQKLYGPGQPRWRKYASFVIGEPSIRGLLSYELRTAVLGLLPGALGLFLRSRFYRPLFRQIGRNVVIGRNVTIRHGDKIDLGDNVVVDDGSVLDARGAGEEGLVIGANTIIGRGVIIQSKLGFLRIGENCGIGTYSVITSQGGLEIGDWVQIAGGCKLSGGRFKLDPAMTTGLPYIRYSDGPIRIEDGCLLGGTVKVTDNVTIGRSSVVGTGAVVTSNIPPFSVFMPRPGMIMGKTIADATGES